MTDSLALSLAALGQHISSRREHILRTWRDTARADVTQTTADALTRTQFNDHIPEVLTAFARKLRSRPGSSSAAVAEITMEREELKHGLQRWQQGYTLLEVMREWGYLQLCLCGEIEQFASAQAMSSDAQAAAYRELAQLINEGVSESALQYARMERFEAEGVARDLESTLATVRGLERQRGALIHQAVHDLRGNIQSIASAADVLSIAEIEQKEREEFATLLQDGVQAVVAMVGDLLELARLEAGQESRQVAPFDAGSLLADLKRAVEPLASKRQLYVHAEGPASLSVEGDAGKLRRLLQNLVLNALKYTERGGLTLSWGAEKTTWWVMVKDTGPGILGGPGSPLAAQIQDATVVAQKSDQKAPAGEGIHVLKQPAKSSAAPHPQQQAGEGIGLSIVKRLCEMLDASLELISSNENGTTFRVVLPQKYPSSASADSGLHSDR